MRVLREVVFGLALGAGIVALVLLACKRPPATLPPGLQTAPWRRADRRARPVQMCEPLRQSRQPFTECTRWHDMSYFCRVQPIPVRVLIP